MLRELAQELRGLWQDSSILKIAVAVALVWSVLGVLQAILNLATSELLFGSPFFDWRFYLMPLIWQVLLFLMVVIVSEFALRAARRREQGPERPEQR